MHGARALQWTLFSHSSDLNRAFSQKTSLEKVLTMNRRQLQIWCFNSLCESKSSAGTNKNPFRLPLELVPVPTDTVPNFVIGYHQKAVVRLEPAAGSLNGACKISCVFSKDYFKSNLYFLHRSKSLSRCSLETRTEGPVTCC